MRNKEMLIIIKSIMFLFFFSFLGFFLIGMVLLSVVPIIDSYELYFSEVVYQVIKDSLSLSLRGALLLTIFFITKLFFSFIKRE